MFDSRYPFGAFYLVALLRLLCVKLANSNFAASNMAHLSDRSGGAPGRSTEWSTGANEGRTACPTLDSVQIEPSCSDVGFGEVLHAALASVWRRKLLVGGIVAGALALGIIGIRIRHFREDQSDAAALSPHNPTRVQFIQWLLDGTVVKRTPQCEGHLIPLGRSFAIGAIHVRGIQGAAA